MSDGEFILILELCNFPCLFI